MNAPLAMLDGSDCVECPQAEADHHHPGYSAWCPECACRALAHAPEGWRAAHALTNAPLRDAAIQTGNRFGIGEDVIQRRIWHWIGRIHGDQRNHG